MMVKFLESLNLFKVWHLISTNCSHSCQNMGASIMLVKNFPCFFTFGLIRCNIRVLDLSQSVTISGREVSYIPLPETVTKTHTHTECRIQLTSQDGKENLVLNR